MTCNREPHQAIVSAILLSFVLSSFAAFGKDANDPNAQKLLAELKVSPFKILYQSWREKNWELFISNADGSNPVNITRTTAVDEVHPQPSPDGTKVVFVGWQTIAGKPGRSLYYMNMDGTGRVKVVDDVDAGCWSSDGSFIFYTKELPAEANKPPLTELFFYNLASRQHIRPTDKDVFSSGTTTVSGDGKYIVVVRNLPSAKDTLMTGLTPSDICVSLVTKPDLCVPVTTDGMANREPVWLAPAQKPLAEPNALMSQLKACKYKIVFQSHPQGNSEIFIINADGTSMRNLTNTADINEYYPHASPDGTQICFDGIDRKTKLRDVYVMNIDGSNRRKIAHNARQACWSPDGKVVACLEWLPDGSREGIFFHELATGKTWEHPIHEFKGLWNICWAPNNKWILTSIGGSLGFGHAIVAIQLDGTKVVELRHSAHPTYQCRPDISPDGKHVIWVKEDFWTTWWLEVADINLDSDNPQPTNLRPALTSPGKESYHPDWSPDGRFIAFSLGPRASRMIGSGQEVETVAKGWDICVVDTQNPGTFVQLTTSGTSNKEADWVFVK